MSEKNYIIADCVCDLSKEYAERKNIGIVRFYIQLDNGRFMDGYEISNTNVIEYYKNESTKIVSVEPAPSEYSQLYRDKLMNYESIIHFTISSEISNSYNSAMKGRQELGEDSSRVHIIDTRTLSSGMSFMIMRALELNEAGAPADQIVSEVSAMIDNICVTFVSPVADNLAVNERISEKTAAIIRFLRIHPVFKMADGKLTIAGAEFGSKERYIKRYVKHCLKNHGNIDDERVFITHAACTPDEIECIKKEIAKYKEFKNVHVCATSATVTCNCGAGTFGVMYMKK